MDATAIESSIRRRSAGWPHKTQVFVPHEGDHYRSRLTHTIEVGQIARALARALGLDDDLAEAVALAHDLGHTPFGHTGEDVLGRLMASHGGFDHNAQTLRIVTSLERRYAGFDGLNLSWETLEGICKHNGPLMPPRAGRPVPLAILDYDRLHPLDLASFPGAEAQAAALADDIAYNAADLDDGLRAGVLAFDQLAEVDGLRTILDEIADVHGDLDPSRRIHELGRRVITRFIEDAIGESGRRLAAAAPPDVDAVRALGAAAVVGFSPEMAAFDRDLKRFLFANLYRHPRLVRVRTHAAEIVADLFERYLDDPASLPPGWVASGDARHRPRRVCDYLAGMTDRFAVGEHRRLFDATPDLL